MLTTVPVSSLSLVGLPSPSWMHLWRAWPPFSLLWREDLAGLLDMPTRPLPAEPPEELWSCLSNSRSSGTMLYWSETQSSRTYQRCHKHHYAQQPVQITGYADGVDHPVLMNWTLRRIFGRGATVNCQVLKSIPRNSKSWLGVRSDFSKLRAHPSLWSSVMVISECRWACSGDSAQINQTSR